jgi:hypothetical protein
MLPTRHSYPLLTPNPQQGRIGNSLAGNGTQPQHCLGGRGEAPPRRGEGTRDEGRERRGGRKAREEGWGEMESERKRRREDDRTG